MLFDDASEIDVLNNIKSQVDGINTFPKETEKPIVSKVTIKQGVLQIALAGDTDERTLKEIGKEIRDDIAAIDGISTVSLEFVRPYEISIEVSEESLRRYGLTLEQVSRVIRNTSLDMPGGTLKTEGGDILLRAKGQAYWGEEFENIVVLTRNDGTKVFLSEIATIRDTFEEGDLTARFNGAAAAIIKVDRVGKEDAIDMAANVFAYIDAYQPSLPPGLELTVWQNEAAGLQERLDTLNSTAVRRPAAGGADPGPVPEVPPGHVGGRRHSHRPARHHCRLPLRGHLHEHHDRAGIHPRARHPGRRRHRGRRAGLRPRADGQTAHPGRHRRHLGSFGARHLRRAHHHGRLPAAAAGHRPHGRLLQRDRPRGGDCPGAVDHRISAHPALPPGAPESHEASTGFSKRWNNMQGKLAGWLRTSPTTTTSRSCKPRPSTTATSPPPSASAC